AIFSLTTCLARHLVPLKSLADAYKSPSISPNFVMQTRCLTDWYGTSAPNPSVSVSFLTVHSLVPYRHLRLDSRTPGICSGPYDDVLRTTCGRNELLMRCREGSYAREGSWPTLYGRYERYFFDRSIPA
ncbi:hypothetical protein K443DRAFT_117523, partial [Laccaria amethystina LaAM-08-1]